jgi:alkylation response protein AidB-like acyl-CoA dehydrogenase
MSYLERERQTLESLLPGLDAALAELPLELSERPGSPAIELFREAGGVGLLVPHQHHGMGASALEAVRVQRALGSRSPSLAVATTMHHFSMATLVALSEDGTGLEWMLMEGLTKDRQIMASGFAEGHPNRSILTPTLVARPEGDGVRLSGSKKPCSLSQSMDLLTASVVLPGSDGPQMAVALVPAKSDGVSVRPFWRSSVLAGAESDEVVLDDVFVPGDLIVRTEAALGELDDLQTMGFVWFEMLMSASYIGAASALVERALACSAPSAVRVALAADLEAAALLVEGVARSLMLGESVDETLLSSLHARYAVQASLARVAPAAAEVLGGMSFVQSDDVATLVASTLGLQFHPPARLRMADALLASWEGRSLNVL